MSSPFSVGMISRFIRENQIDMNQYEPVCYRSYNEFFTRRIRPGMRPLPEDPNILFSPCDCKASVYLLDKEGTFVVKDTEYTAASLLRSQKIAGHFRNGYAVVLRLTVDDYHRYCYIDDRIKSDNFFIPGIYHTVNPIANDYVKIYKENAREFTMMKTKHFGNVVQVEVGALMVGRIKNHQEAGSMKRGGEKGYFEFGGSTIVLLLQQDRVSIREDLIEETENQREIKILQGKCWEELFWQRADIIRKRRKFMDHRVIFHIDVNSAFLSWEAVYRLKQSPDAQDLRNIPAVIGGDESRRHGIVLAASLPAKKYGIRTAETIREALTKCPELTLCRPRYSMYQEYSRAFVEEALKFSPVLEQYSIDEVFLDMTETIHSYGSPYEAAVLLKDRIRDRLGFTVNIGVAPNKLLAKMASDFENLIKYILCFRKKYRRKCGRFR